MKDFERLQSEKPTFNIEALLDTGRQKLKVPCKIYLPKTILEKPKIIFNIPEKIRRIATFFGRFKMSYEILDSEGSQTFFLMSPKVYVHQVFETDWRELSERIGFASPQDLFFVHRFNENNEEVLTTLKFWISENELVSPNIYSSIEPDGSIKRERNGSYKVKLSEGCQLIIDRNFNYLSVDKGVLQTSHMIAELEITTKSIEPDSINDLYLNLVDDFLLVLSFSSRHRTLCLGWSADSASFKGCYYRGDYVFPESNYKGDFNNSLFHYSHFEENLSEVYKKFTEVTDKKCVRDAMSSLVPTSSRAIENDFLIIFSRLESLILSYIRDQGMETVVDGCEWRVLKEELKNVVKNSPALKEFKDKRRSLYQKIGGLNRMSLNDSFIAYCEHFEVPVDDLWPLYSDGNLPSLSFIRNKVIHGDSEFDLEIEYFSLALKNLKFLLERMILRFIGMDLDKSNVFRLGLHDNERRLNEIKGGIPSHI